MKLQTTNYKLLTKRGFTLIELLVVVAIIALLSGVVLASLNGARNKGNNAAVKANLSNIRSQAELLYSSDGNYNKVCGAASATQDPTVASAITEVGRRNSEGTIICGKPASGNASAWAIASDIDGGAFCVDSDGVSRDKTIGGTTYSDVTDALTGATDTACN